MSKNPNKQKYGNYIKKVGYLDIRQKVVLGSWKKNFKGEMIKQPGSTNVFVYHGKHKMTGPFKSHNQAINSANELLNKNIKYSKNPKNR